MCAVMMPTDFLSYGAGVQTFAILCFIEQGVFPKPDIIIFAETRGESEATYKHINLVAEPLTVRLGIPFVRVAVPGLGLLSRSFAKGQTPRPPFMFMDLQEGRYK